MTFFNNKRMPDDEMIELGRFKIKFFRIEEEKYVFKSQEEYEKVI